MTEEHVNILNRNFIIRRTGDQLFLPCSQAITCMAPPFLSNAPYIMCKTERFDASTGVLYLRAPTSYERWGQKAYETSSEVNSDLIMASGVKAFEVLWGSSRMADFPTPYEWSKWEDPVEWIPPPGNEEENSIVETKATSSGTPPHAPYLVNEKYWIAIEALTFLDGKVTFTHFIYPRVGEVTFEIPLPVSRKEFDAVKGYFAKALGAKAVECRIAVTVVGRDIQSAVAEFCQANLFHRGLIEEVDEHIIRKHILKSDEELLLVEEKVKELISLDDGEKNLEGLLDRMEKVEKSKHYYQLRHLASLHEADVFPLRMTGSPVSFVFLLKGRSHYHLVWETYQTEEATYLWRLTATDSKSRQSQMNDLMETIKWLRKKNKNKYIKSRPEAFTRIEHDYAQQDGGLQSWKIALDRCLNT